MVDIPQILNPVTWDWVSISKAAFGAGIGTAAVQSAFALYRDLTLKKEKAAYLALRLAVLLEDYASKCCDFYFDNLNADRREDESSLASRKSLPELPELPEDAEAWRTLDRKLLAQCLEFPNRVRASQNAIQTCDEFSTDDLDLTLDEQASVRGVEAYEIARSLRKTYRLGRATPVFDYYSRLQLVLNTSRQKREDRDKSQAELMQELSAREPSFRD